jgi:hypothetical protein
VRKTGTFRCVTVTAVTGTLGLSTDPVASGRLAVDFDVAQIKIGAATAPTAIKSARRAFGLTRRD